MKNRDRINFKSIIILILSILILLSLFRYIKFFKFKKYYNSEGLSDIAEGVTKDYENNEDYKDDVEEIINESYNNITEMSNEYSKYINKPEDIQEMIDAKGIDNTLNPVSYLKAGIKYGKLFISAKKNKKQDEYGIVKDTERLGNTYLYETNKKCDKCYESTQKKFIQCDNEDIYANKIINNIPQSENGIIPGILENINRIKFMDAINLIIPKFSMNSPKDLMNIKDNDIYCIKSTEISGEREYGDNSWVMLNGMYDIPYQDDIYNGDDNKAIANLKPTIKKYQESESFTNINSNNLQNDMIINLYYFSLICFFVYIISKIMVKY